MDEDFGGVMMTEEFDDALAPLQSLFDKIVAEEMKKLDQNYEKIKKHVSVLLVMAMKGEIIEKREEFVKKLVHLSDAVGDSLSLAAKYRYPLQEAVNLPELRGGRPQEKQPNQPIVIQTQTPQGLMSGFWGGYWSHKIAQLSAKIQEKLSDRPVAATPKVIDEIRALEEVRPLLNQLIAIVFKCLRRYDRFKNEHIKEYLHLRVEEQLAKIGVILVGASRWATLTQKSESRQVAASLAAYAARVAEAQAMRPVFQTEGGFSVEQLADLLARLRTRGIDFDSELERRGF